MASSSSLSSVVSNLVRAQLGASVSSEVTDEDLDKHVADLILREAKQKEEKYFGKEGVRAYYPDEPENKPRPNKRFLSSIIKTVDEHNAVVIETQARIAASAKQAQEEEERRLRRARANEAAGDRLKRLMGGGLRGVVAPPTPQGIAPPIIEAPTPITTLATAMHRKKKQDAVLRERARRGTLVTMGMSRAGAGPSGRGLGAGSVALQTRIATSVGGHDRVLLVDDIGMMAVLHEGGAGAGRKTATNGGGEMMSVAVRLRQVVKNARSGAAPDQDPKSADGGMPAQHPLAQSTVPTSRSPSPEPGPSGPIPSKMDKYFDPAYDPMLDVETPSTTSVNELIPDGAFDHWNVMLELVKQRKEDKERKRREKELAKDEKKKKKKRKHKDDEEEEQEDERARRIRLGLEQPTALDVKYIKRGAIREWDVGKEVT
ncbi:hypothetical protein FS837_009216 [Tulasnella sp. UAMH 9824]|nr:hypothetical protein FS837_009216 [Tulasnella sp. UAMH 9824]